MNASIFHDMSLLEFELRGPELYSGNVSTESMKSTAR